MAYVGDGNNVATSLIEAAALTGHGPASHAARLPPDRRIAARRRARSTTRARRRGAHAVYTDVWVSMGKEAGGEHRARSSLPRHARADGARAPDAVFLHCLPAHRGEEVDAAVIDGPQSLVWEQAANRLPTEQALLHALVTGEWEA